MHVATALSVKAELGYSDARVNKRLRTAGRFATLSIGMEIIPGINDEVDMEEGLTEDMAGEDTNGWHYQYPNKH
jgi:hypothetical protein